jgi:hypothetical protein
MGGFAEGTPTAAIELNGKPYTLGFTLGAMRRAQELGVLEVNAEDATAMMLALPEFVWSCLDEDSRKELSVEQISEMMSPLNTPEIAGKVGELFKVSVPKPDPNAQPAAAKGKKPTAGKPSSKNSGQLAATT